MDAGQKQSSIGDAEHGIALSDANDDDNVTGKATKKGCSANVMRGQLKCHLNFKFLQQLGTAFDPNSALSSSCQSKACMCASICADKVHSVLYRGRW